MEGWKSSQTKPCAKDAAYALSLNYPASVAAYNGLHNQEVYLTRQPATLP